MKKLYSALFIVAFSLAIQAKAQLSTELQARLQTVLDSISTKHKLKGVSAAVLYPGSGVWTGVSGISHEGVPLNSNMLLGMGSNTKTFIAALVLKLQENGLLSINDSIGKWIHNKPNISGQITIKQCLNHTSGVSDYMKNGAINDSIFGNPNKMWTKDELMDLATAPYFAPGTRREYSNTNYIIAGKILELVTGKTHQQLVREFITNPAGLNNTYFYDEPGVSSRMPHQWSMRMNGENLVDMNTMDGVNFIPTLFSMASTAGAMVTTAEDNVLFWHKLTSGQILSPESFRQMTELVNIGGKDGYGLGIFFYSKLLNNRSLYSHGGTFFGFINENMADTTSGVCIAVLTNQDSMNNNGLFLVLMRALHKVTIQMPVGLTELVYNSSSFKLYPNPAINEVYVESKDYSRAVSVSVYDMTGGLAGRPELINNKISVEALAKGIYFIQLTDSKGELVHTQKLVISK